MEPKPIDKKNPSFGEKNYKENKIINLNVTDLFATYIHDIRNLKTLDKEMINNIRNMPNEDIIDIIIALNDALDSLKIFIEE